MARRASFVCVLIFLVKGVASSNSFGTFYERRGTTTMTSSSYVPTPFTVGDLSSAEDPLSDPAPAFLFVPGSNMDKNELFKNRYQSSDCEVTFNVSVRETGGILQTFLKFEVTTNYNQTDCEFNTSLSSLTFDTIELVPFVKYVQIFQPGVDPVHVWCHKPECYTERGTCPDLIDFLDDAYSDPFTPLILSADESHEIKAQQMPTETSCGVPQYKWRVHGVSADQQTFFKATQYSTSNNVLLITANRLDPGMYIVILEVVTTLPQDTHFEDYIYVRIKPPELKAIIFGSAIINVAAGNAATLYAHESYDPAIRVPSVVDYPLDAEWYVFSSNAVTETDVHHCVVTFPYCDVLTSSTINTTLTGHNVTYNGIYLQFDASIVTSEWAFVIYTMTHQNRRSSALAVVHIIADAYVYYSYSCVYNCISAVASKRPSGIAGFDVAIYYNTHIYDVNSMRDILEWDETSGAFTTSSVSLIGGQYSDTMSLTDSPLVAGKSYLLSLNTSLTPKPAYAGGSYVTQYVNVVILRNINDVPYGGSCIIDKTSGNATNEPFTITCSGWMDEEERARRDALYDVNPRLTYMVVQRAPGPGGDPVDETLVVSGKTSMTFTLMAGDPNNGYQTTVVVMILDILNEAAEVNFTVTARPVMDVSTVTADKNGAETINKFTSSVNASFYEFEDDIDMSIPVGISAGKLLNSISVPPSDLDIPVTLDGDPDILLDINLDAVAGGQLQYTFDSYLDALNNNTLDPATVAIRKSIELITVRIKYVMDQRVSSGQKYFDQNYIDQMTQCFTQLIAVQSYVTDKTKTLAEAALYILALASGQIWTNQPQSDNQQINSQSQLVDMTGNIVGVVVPDTLNQARVVYDVTTAYDQIDDIVTLAGPNMTNAIRRSVISPTERAYLYLKSQKNLQSELSTAKDLAKSTASSMHGMVQDILKTTEMCTGCSQVLGKGSMIQNVTVLPKNILNNVTLTMDTMALNLKLGVANASNASTSGVPMAMTLLDKNIFMYDADLVSSFISYGVMHVELSNDTSDVTLDEVTYEQNVDHVDRDVIEPFVDEDDVSQFSLHKFLYRSAVDELCITLEPLVDGTSRYDAYIRFEEAPTILDYDVTFSVTASTSWVKCIESSNMRGHTGMTYLGVKRIPGSSSSRKKRDTTYTYNEHPDDVNEASGTSHPTSSAYRRYVTRKRNKRSTTSVNVTSSQHPPYYFAIVTASCLSWDESQTSWKSDYCKLTWQPTSNKVECVCRNVPQMTFGTSFFVAPTAIDFSTAFLKFSPKSQAAVIGVIVAVIVIYVLLLVWARKQDKKDMLKWGILPLADNYANDDQCYLISVHTGLRLGAATSSRVAFVLSGHRTDTGVREMYDGVRKEYPTGSVLQFLMTTQYNLGQLTHLRIWHDNSGPGSMASWYLSRVTVYDMKKRETYNFLCENWLSVETCSGNSLECTLPATNPENEAFDYTFVSHAKRTLSDDHTWASFLYRPNYSNFTRTQRVTCAILFIAVNAVVNAMYYNPGEEYETDALLEVGPARLSLTQLYVSIITALITTPSTFVIVLIFKMSRRSTMRLSNNGRETVNKDKYRAESQADSRPDEKEVSCCARVCSGPRTDDVPVMYIEEEHKKCLLPSKFAYVGWFLAIGGMVTSAFFVLLYSMQWGEQKSGEWLATFFMSLLQSVFFVDPIKVAVMAIGLALVKKTLENSDFKKIDAETVENMAKTTDQSDELPRLPLSQGEVKVAREKSQVATRWNRIVLDLVFNVLFLWLLFSISYSNTHAQSYNAHRVIVNALSRNATGDDEFGQISSASDFYKWLRGTAIPSLFPDNYYNGEVLHWTMREFVEGLVLYRVGPPRLRQFRIEEERCHLPGIDTKDCYRGYSLTREETDDFCIGWGIPPCLDESINLTSASWRYTDLDTTDSLPMLGTISTYHGDGYFMTMDINRNTSLAFVDELYDNVWIDRHTRAVVLEFTVFCANINLFVYSLFMVEFPASGSAFASFSVFPARIYQHEGTYGSYIFACEILGLLFMVLLFAQIIYNLFIYKRKAFRKFWFLLDFLKFCVLVATIALYVIRQRVLASAITKYREDQRTFVDFYQVTCWNQLVIYMLGVAVFMSTIRVLKILEGNKNIYIISSVFARLASHLFWFGVLFFYFLFTFAMLGFLLFGSQLGAYMNLYTSMVTLIVSLMGKSRFAEMDQSDPILAKIYYFFFVCIISMVMFSIILSSLNQCINRVQEDFKAREHKEDAFHYGFSKIAAKVRGKGDRRADPDRVYPWRDVNSRQTATDIDVGSSRPSTSEMDVNSMRTTSEA